MSERYTSIGIKQTIRLEWMDKTVNLLMAGLDAKTIRQELHGYLSEKKGSGNEEKRGEISRSQAVNILMRLWISPDPQLIPFRDACIDTIRHSPINHLPVHWSMISAAYPFWFNTAKQVGRLFALQEKINKSQVLGRLKELYGDRETVSRYSRAVLRSFIAWGVIKDSSVKGRYEKAEPMVLSETQPAILLLESILHTVPEGFASLEALQSNPGLFPFNLPVMAGDFIQKNNQRITMNRFGLDVRLGL